MDDLSGLNWSAKPNNGQKQPNYNKDAFSLLTPTLPNSSRASPLSPPTSRPFSSTSTPVNDSFSNLVSFSSNHPSKNLSLQEQQKRLEESKLKQRGGLGNIQFGAVDDSVWNKLGSGRSTPVASNISTSKTTGDDDFLAAFNAPRISTPVQPSAKTAVFSVPKRSQAGGLGDDDDDPFGLSEFQARQSSTRPEVKPQDDDDDVLGLLGQPVRERPAPVPRQEILNETASPQTHPQQKALTELLDMGFSIEKASRALEATESGYDVQAAVGWLLNQAHDESRSASNNRSRESASMDRQSRPRNAREDMTTSDRSQRSATPSTDPAKLASEIGANFLKTAGSLWKQGQKKVQQAVQELNSDSDTSQPKWMKDTSTRPTRQPRTQEPNGDSRRNQNPDPQSVPVATDEALMLENSRPERPARPSQRPRQEGQFDSSADVSRDHSPAVPSRLRETHAPPVVSRARPAPQIASKPVLSRQAADEQAAAAYISSARRRKPAQAASSAPSAAPDLLQQSTSNPTTIQASASRPIAKPVKATPIEVRPPAPKRTIPAVSAIAMKASHADREAGNEHFKRGDYSSAHQSYTKSLSYMPASHPITIILLTNRALTALKTGEPKTAIADSDATIRLIGPSKGESEIVDLGLGEAPKAMRDYYGKALMRKAEALEQLERWKEAATVWREAVEGGHGGATSIQGRARAEKASNPQSSRPKPLASKPAPAPAPVRRPPTSKPATEAAAVKRLRQQNAAAEKADDEKFALADAVDAKINAWRGGKADNLRALLGSLDTVLWPEAGWKKISMADLVLPNKVKIQYMKGIAKVHPDKIPKDATTEQQMIAGAVFSTLNEAWDKFKKENGL